jgi:hypothetical protein
VKFQPTIYLEAVKATDFSTVECNLAFSGVDCPYSLAELGITATVLEGGEFESYGHPGLKAAIAERCGANPDQVLSPGGGSTLCNFLITAALVEAGDRILVERPTYEPLIALAKSTDGEVAYLPRPFDRSFDFDPAELLSLMTPPVKLVILTRLHNPSGKDIPPEKLVLIGERAEETGAYVLVDEVYLDFLPEENRLPACRIHPRLISVNSLTKVYGLGLMRIGWAIGPVKIVQRAWRINNLLGSIPPRVPENVAYELFRNGGLDRIGAWARRRARENRRIVEDWMEKHPDLEWVKPDGGIIAYIGLKSARFSDGFIKFLREKFRTAVMPGRYFDLPGGFRLGFGIPDITLREGLRRIDLALNEYRNAT